MISLPAIPSASEIGCEPEPFATGETIPCDPTPKPGVEAFRDWVMSVLGGGDSGITRSCSGETGTSSHHAGQAWDWRLDASDPDDADRAKALIDWLLAPDPDGNEHAMFRRSGLAYMIWNRESWYAWRPYWQPYTGPNPHTYHVHFSFSKAGANGETSFFEWLGMKHEPTFPPTPQPGPEPREDPSVAVPLLVGLGACVAAGLATYYALERQKPTAG